jgi:hypothetical protein
MSAPQAICLLALALLHCAAGDFFRRRFFSEPLAALFAA